MLKTMRESFHHLKWTLFAVIIVFVLGFVFSRAASSTRTAASQIVARVGSASESRPSSSTASTAPRSTGTARCTRATSRPSSSAPSTCRATCSTA